jgi:hypothetical protein
VTVSRSGAADLYSMTGCSNPTGTKFHAVAGTWSSPVLIMEGAGCRFGAQWQPLSKLAEVRVPASK